VPNLDNPVVAEAVQYARNLTASQFSARPGERYRVNNLSLEFASLAKQAGEGDLVAARTLFESLERCAHAPRDPEQLRRELKYHARDLNRPRNPDQPYDAGSEASIAMNLEAYRRCSGVTDEHIASRARWGTQLAEAGDWAARVQYQEFGYPTKYWEDDYEQQLKDYRDQSWRYLDQRLQSRHVDALAHFGHFYMANKATPRDYFKAYVYMYAYVQQPGLSAYDSNYMGLRTASNHLTPDQIAEAERQGRALYLQCCQR
jgi:hypothetical protein